MGTLQPAFNKLIVSVQPVLRLLGVNCHRMVFPITTVGLPSVRKGERNEHGASIDRRFSAGDARNKLKSLIELE